MHVCRTCIIQKFVLCIFESCRLHCITTCCMKTTTLVLIYFNSILSFTGNYVLQYLGNRLGLAGYVTQALVQVCAVVTTHKCKSTPRLHQIALFRYLDQTFPWGTCPRPPRWSILCMLCHFVPSWLNYWKKSWWLSYAKHWLFVTG